MDKNQQNRPDPSPAGPQAPSATPGGDALPPAQRENSAGGLASWLDSLQFKLSAATLAAVLAFIWGLTLYALETQRAKLESMEKEQQLASVRYRAAELENKLGSRLSGLRGIAANIDIRRLDDGAYLQDFLEQRYLFQQEFSGGTSIIGIDGRVLADFPIVPGRRGSYYGDRDYFRQAVATRRVYVDKAVMERALHRPVLTMSAPVIDRSGQVRAVLTGIIDLTSPSFLGLTTDPQTMGNQEIYLVSLKENMILASSDRARIMTALPAGGKNEMIDHLRAGFEGSLISISSRNIEKLYSAKRIAESDWILVLALPTDIAFQPVRSLRDTLLGGAIAATVAALLLVAWLSRRTLTPLRRASAELDAMSSGHEPIRQLEENGESEIRSLLASFNRLTAHLQARQNDLQRSERTYHSLFTNMLNGFVHCRMLFADGRPQDLVFLAVNPAFETQTGLRDVVGRTATEIHPGIWKSDPELLEIFGRVARTGVPESFEIYLRAFGHWFSLAIYSPERDHFAIVFDVVTKRKEQQERIARLVRIYAVLSSINSAIVRIHDRQALLDSACQVAVEAGKFGIAWIGLLGPDGQTLTPVAGCGIDLEAIRATPFSIGYEVPDGQGSACEALGTRRAVFCNDITLVPQVGPVRAQALDYGYRSVCVLPLLVDGKGIGVMGLYAREAGFFDADEMKLLDELAADISFALQYIEREERLDYLAYYDALTGLPNRALFLDRLGQMIQGQRDGNHTVVALLLDLERFTLINENYGRHVGDALLKAVAERLSSTVRQPCSIARVGADTFAVAVNGQQHGVDAASVVQERIFSSLCRPFQLDGIEIRIAVHAGISLHPDDARDAETLFQNAEAALKEAQSARRRSLFYAPEINTRLAASLALEREMQAAFEAGQFFMHYQPRVNLLSGEIVGAEALIRWQHPARGLVPPAEFIPLAERSGLIVPIGAWVVDTVCAQQAAWQAEGMDVVPVAVNLSPLQFAQGDVLSTLEGALTRHGLESKCLELELTESLVMQDPEEAAQTMKGLRKFGLRLSLDDFGTGYSSLAYLQRFPFDAVKIDRSFISNITQNPGDAAIATAVIAMSHRLNLQVVAEGVETEGQLRYLRQHGCDQIQGYFFSPPVPAADFADMLRKGKRLNLAYGPADPDARTVLIVDDEPGVLSALYRVLRREGYRVLKASSGREGLELLASNRVQVIISDQRMPGMSGSEFLSIVKELHPATIRIILSGYTDLQVVTDAVNRGAVYKFLTKPWDDELLKENIRDAFLRYQPTEAEVESRT